MDDLGANGLVQHVVPADTCDRQKGSDGSSERAIPAEVADLEAELSFAECVRDNAFFNGLSGSARKCDGHINNLKKRISAKRSQSATGGNDQDQNTGSG
jgi:hypothetical protein